MDSVIAARRGSISALEFKTCLTTEGFLSCCTVFAINFNNLDFSDCGVITSINKLIGLSSGEIKFNRQQDIPIAK